MLRSRIATLVRPYARRAHSTLAKPIFYDMVHSNNAARVRLWMQLKRPGGMTDFIETRTLAYPDLQSAEFARINPLKKVPALIRTDGTTVFESNVILSYPTSRTSLATLVRRSDRQRPRDGRRWSY